MVRLVVPRHRVGVAVVALSGERVLLLRHVFHPTAPWGLPGGWLGRREGPAGGALRELKEETGLDGMLGPIVFSRFEPRPPHLGLAFVAEVREGPLRLSAEIMEADWFPLDALPEPLLPFVHRAIEAARAWRATALPAGEALS